MAQKTIDFEKDILEPIDTLKQGLSAESDARKKDVQKLDDNKITKFYTNNQGEKVLNDSDDGKIQDLMIYGKSEQKQYKGKNLLGKVTKNTQTVSGVTATPQDDGSFLLNGTTTKNFVDIYLVGTYGTTIIDTLDSTKKYFVRGSGNDNIKIIIGTRGNAKNIGASGEAIDGIDYAFLYLQIPTSGTTLNNVVIYPQINEGTTLLDYEPYTGGKPSPSPEYPQEIKAVVNPVIKTHGINLLDIKDVTERVFGKNGLTYSVKQGVIKVKGTATSSSAIGIRFLSGENKKITANNTYIFSPNPTKKVESTECYLDFTNNKNLGFSLANSDSINKPVNVQEAQALYLFVLFIRVQKGAKIDMEWKPQLIISNTLLPYQPYQETQATLPYELYAIPVSSGGNVTIDGQQYIADYVDVEHGKLVRKTHVTKFTGAENWAYTDHEGEQARRFGLYVQVKGIPYLGLSNYVINSEKSVVGRENVFAFYEAWIDVRITKFTSLVEFKNFLSEINSSGNPMTVIYALVTPEEIDLMPEAIEKFKALSTYYPKTYITAESEQLEAYTMFNYPVSMEKGWEYVKRQIGDTRKYVYDMETKLSDAEYNTAMAYVNSEYAVALTELGM